jgi:ATP-dependent Clp protease protease subunit
MNKYYYMATTGKEADIYIFGDITSWEWFESDVSSYTLAQEIKALDVDTINVHINSYGGEVAEGLAIYNMLRNHKAKVRTYCDGFACSIASVIFMAGDERVMSNASLLMVHNAWQYTYGNAEELRKAADDLDIITQASINAYMAGVKITEEELKQLLDNETWLLPQDAVDKGFATSVTEATTSEKATASARQSVVKRMTQKGMTVNVRMTDMPELQAAIADIQAKIAALKEDFPLTPADPPPGGNPTPPAPESKLSKFFNALTGGKA